MEFRNFSKKPPSDENLKFLIEDSVKIRKRSDVPVGSYLSGGLDSTILSYLLRPINTWTVGFEEMNEFSWSDIASNDLKSKHKKVLISGQEFIDIAKSMIKKRKRAIICP